MGQTFSVALQKELEALENPKVALIEISLLQKQLASLLNRNTKDNFNIAFVGASGVGKSSLINAVRGLRNQVENHLYAKADQVECTQKPAKYVYPGHEHIVLWDIPGGGTSRHKAERYFYDQSLDTFDFLIIVVGVKMTELDIKIAKDAQQDGVPFALVKSKLDQSIPNKIKHSGKTCDDAKAELSKDLKKGFSRDLEKSGLTANIFVVSEVGFDVNDKNFVAYRNDELKLMKMVLTISDHRRLNRSQNKSRSQISVSENDGTEQSEVANNSAEMPMSRSIKKGLTEEETASISMISSKEDPAVSFTLKVNPSLNISTDSERKQMEQTLAALVEMGFDKKRAERAGKATSGTSVEEATDWLVAHQDELDVGMDVEETGIAPKPSMESSVEIAFDSGNTSASASSVVVKSTTLMPVALAPVPAETTLEVHSYKCDDCGKFFRVEDEIQFHAVKYGHTRFSESTEAVKALTEDEKKERLNQLQASLKAKRDERQAEEKKKAIELEKHRRKNGQEMLAAKQRIEEQEMKKLAEDRKKQKREDALTKQKILDQIKLDREAKKKENATAGESSPPVAKVASDHAPVAHPDEKKSYDSTKIQIRLLNGTTMTQTFQLKESLSAVRLYIDIYRTDGDIPFSLMTQFPKRTFTDEDMETPLDALGMVPSATVILVKK